MVRQTNEKLMNVTVLWSINPLKLRFSMQKTFASWSGRIFQGNSRCKLNHIMSHKLKSKLHKRLRRIIRNHKNNLRSLTESPRMSHFVFPALGTIQNTQDVWNSVVLSDDIWFVYKQLSNTGNIPEAKKSLLLARCFSNFSWQIFMVLERLWKKKEVVEEGKYFH